MPSTGEEPAHKLLVDQITDEGIGQIVDQISREKISSAWLRLLRENGTTVAHDRMSGYYGNLAIIAALMVGAALTVLVELDYSDATSWYQAGASVTGVTSIALMLASVLDSVLICMVIKKLGTPEEFERYIVDHSAYLGWPVVIFVAGMSLAMLEMLLFIVETSGPFIVVYSTVGMCVFGFVMISRYREQSAWFGQLSREATQREADSDRRSVLGC